MILAEPLGELPKLQKVLLSKHREHITEVKVSSEVKINTEVQVNMEVKASTDVKAMSIQLLKSQEWPLQRKLHALLHQTNLLGET